MALASVHSQQGLGSPQRTRRPQPWWRLANCVRLGTGQETEGGSRLLTGPSCSPQGGSAWTGPGRPWHCSVSTSQPAVEPSGQGLPGGGTVGSQPPRCSQTPVGQCTPMILCLTFQCLQPGRPEARWIGLNLPRTGQTISAAHERWPVPCRPRQGGTAKARAPENALCPTQAGGHTWE